MKETKTFIEWLQYLHNRKQNYILYQYSNMPEYNNKEIIVDEYTYNRFVWL